jgi:protein required for attachment to host cells
MVGLAHNVWVALCDGKKALLLQNAGDAEFPKLETRETFEHPDPPTREQGTDKPGRAFAGIGARRGAVENTDWHAAGEEAFVKSFGAHLDRWAQDGRLRDLVVAAPARALGVLRRSLGHATGCVRAEFDKDYVDMPLHEIERHISKMLGR